MSVLRDTVTGTDGCTANGAGPSNPLSGIADTLLGTSSKTRSRLHEYARMGAAPPEFARPVPPTSLSPAEAVQRLARPQHHSGIVPHPLPGALVPSLDEVTRTFERAYLETPSHPVPQLTQTPHAPADQSQVFSSLHSFLHASPHAPPRPPQQILPPSALSVPNKVRIRDRSLILARHLFADHGEAAAQSHADALLSSLGIAPSELPPRMHGAVDTDAWQQIWQQQPHIREPSAMQQAHLQHAHAASIAATAWADDFSQRRAAGPGAAWAEEFRGRSEASGMFWPTDTTWSGEFVARADRRRVEGEAVAVAGPGETGGVGEQWAAEFEQSQAAPAIATAAGSQKAVAEYSRRLASVLAADPQQKFKDSQFLKFLSKKSEGGGDLGAADGTQSGTSWAHEFVAEASVGNVPGAAAWAGEFAAGEAAGRAREWVQDFTAGQPAAGVPVGSDTDAVAAWAEDFSMQQMQESIFDDAWAEVGLANAPQRLGLATEYVFQENNKYDGSADAMEVAREAFQHGSLSEACLALEAVVKAEPRNAYAWRMLGTAHAENDDDKQAIAAMAKALAADPNNPDVLLALGVSHVNELHEGEAVKYLMRWLVADPARAQAMGSLEPPDASQALPHARAAFERAAAAAPEDVDLQTALGVIAHLSGDFRAATAAFERALATQPDEYSLWNKLGATLANSNRSGEAKSAYFRALQCKPGYMRAWTNLGISNGNLGQYRDAAQNYIKALTLNPRGEGVWGYLKTAVVLMGRMDLVGAVDAKDLGALANELGCAELRTALKAN